MVDGVAVTVFCPIRKLAPPLALVALPFDVIPDISLVKNCMVDIISALNWSILMKPGGAELDV